MRRKNLKRILLILVILTLFFGFSFAIYAATAERTEIVCTDINLFNALKNELPNSLLISTDSTKKTITIPTDTLNNITELTLKNSNISDITGLENFKKLKQLNLSNNSISRITALEEMEELEILNLSDNRSIGNNISVLSNKLTIKQLNLSNTGISNVESLSNLKSITHLDISNNNINNLQPIQPLTSIISLNVSNNKNLVTLNYIKTHTALQELNISGTGITDLGDLEKHDGIQNLRKLRVLNVRGLKVENLYPIVDYYYNESDGENHSFLNELTTLDISYTNGLSFDQLSGLKNITELYMLGDNVYSVYGITNLNKLNYINLEENHIQNIDDFVQWDYDENGRQFIKSRLSAKEIVLKNNEIQNLNYLDLSYNKIYNINSIEGKTLSKGLHLECQNVDLMVYQKRAQVNQYIILPSIIQQSKNPSSKVYSNGADIQWKLTGMTLNPDSNYQSVGNYNVIIDYNKTNEDTLNITLSGGVADGTIINYHVESSSSAIDSLVFEDEKLCEAIYNCLLNNKDEYSTLARAKYILNIEQSEISKVTQLDISGYGIKNLTGLESFENLNTLYASENNFTTIDPLKYCTNIQDLNVSNSKINDNNSAIIEMKELTKLDLSNTGMTNIDNIKKLIDSLEETGGCYIEDLNISSNMVKEINGLGKIERLEYLYMANNEISDISEIKKLTNLRVLNVSSNEIKDITPLKSITTLRTLNVSNNKITDISPIYSGITALYFSGNKVKDIDSLSRMTSLTDLVMNNNKIEDISKIQNLLINHEFSMEQQEISRAINSNATGTIKIDLPQVFIAAKQLNNKIYSSNDFEVNNCTIVDNQVVINVDELNDNIATVRIVNGNAKGTTLAISEPIKSTITYSTDKVTNQNVTAKISFNKPNITITNNNGSDEYVFENNGEFTFEFEDEYAFSGEETAKVDWIDKDRPVLTVKYNKEGKSIKATITANEKISIPNGWEDATIENQTAISKVYNTSTEETIKVRDVAGNETSIKVSVVIDTIAPSINGVEDGKTYNNDVTPVITDENLSSVTLTKDGSEVKGYTSGTTIKENGEYILVAKDSNDNTTTVSFKIQKATDDRMLGDVNKNNKIDSGDVLMILRHIAQNNSQEVAKKHSKWKISDDMTVIADVNKNNKIDSGDTLVLLRYISAMNNEEVARKHPTWLNLK